MKEKIFPLSIYINHHLKGRIRVFVDDKEIYAVENIFTCELNNLEEHQILVIQEVKPHSLSIDGLSIFEKNYSFFQKRKKVVINKPIISSKWSAVFKINKKAKLGVGFDKQFYIDYAGFYKYYYLGKVNECNGISFKKQYASINWSSKQKMLYYLLIHLKNSSLFLLSLFCFGYQICEGLSIADKYIAASYTGYQYMVLSIVFLICSIIAYVYFSYKLYNEYKST